MQFGGGAVASRNEEKMAHSFLFSFALTAAVLILSWCSKAAFGQEMQNPPVLVSFDLNLNPQQQQLTLNFDSAVVPSTCVVELLTLQNTSSNAQLDGLLIPDTNGTCVAGSTSSSVVVQLSDMDWFLLQGNVYLATSASNTYLSALAGFILDATGIGSEEVSGLRVRNFTPDNTPPVLITGGLDFSAGSLGLIFDKAVMLDSIVATGVSLMFMNTSTNTMNTLTLSGADQFGYFESGSQIFIMLIQSEFFPLKLTSADPYTVTLAANTVTSIFGVPNQAQNDIQLFNVAPDFDPPLPTGFSLDMNTGTLVITFQEPVGTAPNDYDLSQVYLVGTPDLDALIAYNLSNSSLLSSEFYSSRLTFSLGIADLNMIKLDTSVCTNIGNCFLVANDTSFVDTEGNIAQASLTPASDFTADTTPPQLLSFAIDLDSGLLSLTFSEPLLTSSIDLSFINIYGQGGSGTPTSLAGNDFNSTELDSVLLLDLGPDKLNPIKSLATSGTVSLALSSNAATDTNDNSIVPILSSNALTPAEFITDTTPPSLIGFVPGYPAERRITLVFDEYIAPVSWNGNQFNLILTTRQGQFQYLGFTQGTVSNTVSDQIVYSFSQTEFMSPFSDQYTTAYYQGLIILEPSAGLISDVSGNVFTGSAPLVYRNSTLPPDTEKPRLESFVLDLDMGALNMTFSEAVTIVNVADQVTLQDAPVSPVNAYTLMNDGMTTSNLASEFITIVLNITDLNNIKSMSGLGTSPSNTYLMVTELLAMDLFDNLLENITVGLQATSVIADTQSPTLISFKVNIDNSQLTIDFSEPMSTSVDLSQVFLGGTSQNPSPQYNMSGSSLLTSEALTTRLIFSIAPKVLQQIKFDTSVCSELENCFLFLAGGSFSDVSGNSIIPITIGLSPVEFTPDLSRPQLLTFSIDLNVGTMTLSFSEPTDTAGFNPSGITLTSSSETGTLVMPSDAFIASATELNTRLMLTLGSTSLNNIKVLYLSQSLLLTLAGTAIMDTAGNPVLDIPSTTPLQPEIILQDITSPTLRAFAPNPPSERRFTFFFDEYVSASTWDGSRLFIMFSSAQGNNEYNSFTTGTVTPTYSDTINYTFSSTEFVPPLSTDYTNAFTAGSFSLRTTFNLIEDLGLNPLFAITTPIRFTNDTNRPVLNSYSLDLNAGTLSLIFSEAVSINTVVNQVRLQNTAISPTRVYSLASNGTLSISPGTAAASVTITLAVNDLNSIKFDQNLATTSSNTYLVILEGLGSDISGNPLVGLQTGLQATNIFPDRQGPVVTSTAVDMNSGTVSLRFNEPISQTVDLSQIFVTGTAQTSPGGYSLTGSVAMSPTELATLLTIRLSSNVLNMIKVDSQVCTGRANCFIYYTATSLSDISGNQVTPSSPAMAVSNFTEDATSPRLTSYTVDLNQGLLILTFSEATNGMVSPFGVTLLGTSSGSGSITFDFSTNTTFQMYNTILIFTLDLMLLNQLKVISSMGPLGLTIDSTTIYDNNNIPVVSISMSSPLPPATVVPDSTPPTLLMFIPGYPMERRLTLVFDEFVNPSTWDGSRFTLTLTTVQGVNSYTSFTQGTLPVMFSDRIVYSFSSSEFSQFSTQYSDAYYEGMIAFTAQSGLVSDIAGNTLPAVTTPLVFQNTTTPVSDTPYLTSFELDMNTGTLLLTFSEEITVSAVSNNVQLQNTATNPTQFYALTQEGTISTTAISTVLSLTVDLLDLNNIKLLTFLATSLSNTFIQIRNGFGRDAMNNFFNSSINGPVQAAAFTPDTTPPRVASFDLYNDDNGSMIVSFNEPINIGSIDTARMSLIGGANSVVTYTLTAGLVMDTTGERVSFLFTLLQSDLAGIRQTSGLAEDVSTTNLVVGANMCADVAGNSILQVPTSSPIPLTTYIADTGDASLQSFDLDMNFGVLVLTFNDVIDVTTVNVANITIQNSSMSAMNSYSLTGSQMISPTSSRIIQIQLSFTDWNALRSNLYLATSRTDTYISFPASFANTVGAIPLIGVPATSALLVTTYTRDTRLLQLSLFSVDLNQGLLRFEFIEPVLVSSANPTAIQLQNAEVSPSASFTLTGGVVTTSAPTSLSIDIEMNVDDIIALDGIPNLATTRDNTYINYVGNFINDTSGNMLLAVAMQVSIFLADVRSPQLLYFDANLVSNPASLTLRFSEGVRFVDGAQGSFTLQDGPSSPQTTLTFNIMEMITQPARDTLVITLRSDYFSLLNIGNGIGSSGNRLYITYSGGGVSDYFGNQVDVISSNNAQRVRYIYRDCQSNMYNNLANGTCDLCASVCVGGCTGNLTIAGEGGCNMCYITLLDSIGNQDTCIAQTNTCPQGYYTSTRSYPTLAQIAPLVCSPCHPDCTLCNGPSNTDCQACNTAFQTAADSSTISQCLSSCSNSSDQCTTCHSQCNGCRGPTDRDCVSCRESNVTTPNQEIICVSDCEVGMYLNTSTYSCQSCNAQCLSCVGPANTQCLECRGATMSGSGGGMVTCLSACPDGMFMSPSGVCQDCHELCSGGCYGPSDGECNSCKGNSVMASENTTRCVMDCPFAQNYDIDSESCVLSNEATIAAIVCGVVGGLLLIIFVIIVPCICCIQRRARKGIFSPKGDAPLIARSGYDDSLVYGNDYNVTFTAASSPL